MENTDDLIYKTASETIAPDGSRKVRPFSEYHSKMQTKLFGHVLRAKENDPLRQVSLLPGTANRLPEWKGRGRGKKKLTGNLKEVESPVKIGTILLKPQLGQTFSIIPMWHSRL